VTEQPAPDLIEGARQLWAGRFQGVLSTHALAEPGYPFGSVLPYCLDRQGFPLFLLSHLAQHTHNLDADPRCAFTIAESTQGDVQQSLRLTCLGECDALAPTAAAVAADRYLRYFPAAHVYLRELNFRMYRLRPHRFHCNGGFATARWAASDRILRATDLDDAEEKELLRHIREIPARELAALLPSVSAPGAAVRPVAIDPWGLDVRCADQLIRLHFTRALASAAAIDTYLCGLLR
jgi:putative heme iron utilization protein